MSGDVGIESSGGETREADIFYFLKFKLFR